MKVLWIADFGLNHNIGGAQRTDSYMIKESASCGINLTVFHHDSDPSILYNKYDILISGNLELLSRSPDVFSYIVNHPNHIRFEHDANAYLPQEMRQRLFGSTKLAIFLSQFHIDQFNKLYGLNNYCKNTAVVVSPLDTSMFYNREEKREDKTLYIGFLHPFKGTYNFCDYAINNPDKDFIVAGWGPPKLERSVSQIKNVDFIGKVSYEQMPELYNKYKTLYYHPEKFEPFCRSVGEAILCGIELNCGDNIGAIHEYFKRGYDGLKMACENSPKDFWNKVKETVCLA